MTDRPVLTIVRLVRWGCGFRYIIAEGIGDPIVYHFAFKDIADTFPDDAVLVVATYPPIVSWWPAADTTRSGH